MSWPPLKAWTSNISIEGQVHFVAINYGGESKDRWVVLMSVLDSSLVVKVSWSQLIDPSNWKCGWDENNDFITNKLTNSKCQIRTTESPSLSVDSGLTIPISTNIIRPWFSNI
tara:strand:- start:250 stop:588 length:339 start_codon:yes stop_codon:yes gene_type:complete